MPVEVKTGGPIPVRKFNSGQQEIQEPGVWLSDREPETPKDLRLLRIFSKKVFMKLGDKIVQIA